MRSYAALLVLEDIFNYVPTSFPDVVGLAGMIFTPNLPIVSVDCNTTLGDFKTVNYELEGAVELATDLVISKNRIDQLLYSGVYEISTRSTSTCVAHEGICQKCYNASNQYRAIPAIGSRVTIEPEYLVKTDVINANSGDITWRLSQPASTYQSVHIYVQGVLQNPATYTITNQTLTFNTALASAANVVVHFTRNNLSPFLVYLAKTYSGSLLGMASLPAPALPIRSLLLKSLIPDTKLQSVVEYTTELPQVSQEFKNYLTTIQDPLEQSLFALALNCIFANAI